MFGIFKRNKMYKIASYGSLRKDLYNFEKMSRMSDGGLQYEATVNITGPYKLVHSHDYYPYLIPAPGEENTIVVDILQASKEVKQAIDYMETDAGYVETKIDLGGDKVTLYVFSENLTDSTVKEVPNGDWKEVAKF